MTSKNDEGKFEPFHSTLPQSPILTLNKQHGLFLTITLDCNLDPHECLKAISRIRNLIEEICPASKQTKLNELEVGVGFGPNWLAKVQSHADFARVQPFQFKEREGEHGKIPKTDGDLFIHAKCDIYGSLYELAKGFLEGFPPGGITKYDDVYGWQYKEGRDLTGFIDGTENSKKIQKRAKVTIDPVTGGSYLIAMKWIHRFNVLKTTPVDVLESWIGRKMADSEELQQKTITSHVARITGGTDFHRQKEHRLLRHSMPWGTLSGESGLFFIGYAANPATIDWMLDRITGNNTDHKNDDLMRFSDCVESTYYYLPSQTELDRLTASAVPST